MFINASSEILSTTLEQFWKWLVLYSGLNGYYAQETLHQMHSTAITSRCIVHMLLLEYS